MNLPEYAFFKGEIVPYSEAKVGVLTHALNYGTGVFGGVRAYKNDENGKLYLFRPYDHYKRFLNSCKMMLMDFDETPESMTQHTIDLVKKGGFSEDVYIRPLAYKSEEIIGVKLHDVEADFTIVALPFGKYVSNDTNAHVTVSSWRRLDDNVIPARGKISGAYANSAFIKTDAVRSGFDEALVLTQSGHLSEGSAENIFMVRDGVLITPAVYENILEGITRRSIMQLAAKELRMEVVERPVDRTEIYICDELFMTGTAAQVTAITKIDHRPVGEGVMGPVAMKLRELFFDILRGKNKKYKDWNVEVR
ncbi:MAG TPA: branched-chain amino acid transaminase [Anaerolineales bacterium]|nr:branched-chain amino acid transaminase [Anaerolineales bacterium]